MIPDDAEKPADPRREEKIKTLGQSLSSELVHVIEATSLPMPTHDPDAILKIVREERERRQYEAELAYLRGDFARTMRCYDQTEGDEAAKLRVSLVAVAAAISLGDYRAYSEIETYLKGYAAPRKNGGFPASLAEVALASAAVSMTAPNMVPDWLKDGDFSAFPPQASYPYLIYLRVKYFQCIGGYEAMLAAAQTALTFCRLENDITFPEIYLWMTCAVACHYLGREEDARRRLLKAMRRYLPHGFITPFAELASESDGLVEQCLEEAFPDYYDAVVGQWKRTVKNWIAFHNKFTRDNITLILSLREYHFARLVARRVPYAKIAQQFNISVGRLKNIMLEIYEKLYISGRDDLVKYVLTQRR